MRLKQKIMYCNFRRHDRNGRRVAIFGQQQSDGTMVMTVITCSKKDQFSKKFARNSYDLMSNPAFAGKDISLHPEIYSVILTDMEHPKKFFLNWCKQNYFLKKVVNVNAGALGIIVDVDVQKGVKLSRVNNIDITLLVN